MRSKFDQQLALLNEELTQMGETCAKAIGLAAQASRVVSVAAFGRILAFGGISAALCSMLVFPGFLRLIHAFRPLHLAFQQRPVMGDGLIDKLLFHLIFLPLGCN